ncbi:hypothetical protein H4582DRAFT_2052239 [Lactarius indigo]|nr:hypothetical protein H4582DRAFT_2052239 [Lactarius indigo]
MMVLVLQGRPLFLTTNLARCPSRIPTLLSYLLIIGSARAQVIAPNCSDSSFTWSYNSLQQTPCLVTAYLAAVCNNGAFTFYALQPGNYYTGPGGSDNGDPCKCNTVVYNLISACGACQGESWIPYSTWSFNCTKATAGNFPKPVPNVTRVPHWAYIDSSISGNWNISAAQLAGDSPEVTGTASISAPHHSSNAGPIAGGVIGAALIVGVIVWFSIRRRRARSAPHLDVQCGETEQPPSHPPKFYDPLDPTTHPSTVYLPVANQRPGSTPHLQPITSGYSGLPEGDMSYWICCPLRTYMHASGTKGHFVMETPAKRESSYPKEAVKDARRVAGDKNVNTVGHGDPGGQRGTHLYGGIDMALSWAETSSEYVCERWRTLSPALSQSRELELHFQCGERLSDGWS